ncbi:hypothetical protein [Fluoribacter gormanii]|uniref:Uncharacterized protein n=1 Tax=Fluoribacter gormanii TaxID=464 RepID=A0A377GGV4_9GAMM|nr:hypothetical protein [Fluoribacter gormanii]KTD02275.1 hypothetical protein Lgor_2031 [Fluoribacter gormanii]MCW8444463.1 hypothetical protein [Fluoribacter gormanii]SIR27496.1 hypothetical protein SAMN05421777_10962 [Fluoribacter gormanii]STO24016.1 Uncharacterised protein [Fluoribacter gormanii]
MHNIELLAIRDHKTNGMAVCLKPKIPYIITPSLVHEIRKLQNKIAEQYYAKPWDGVYYLLWYLHSDTTPWKGLDFHFIHEALLNHHEHQIEIYIESVFELLFINYVGLGLPLINCSFINRKLSGISQDFFYLNRVNFIKRYKELNCSCSNKLPFSKLNFNPEIKKASLPLKIYTRNNFYAFDAFNLNSMKKILHSHRYLPIPQPQQNEIRLTFNQISQQTIARIYQLASENINLIERFSVLQSIASRK